MNAFEMPPLQSRGAFSQLKVDDDTTLFQTDYQPARTGSSPVLLHNIIFSP